MNPFASILTAISDWSEHNRDARRKSRHHQPRFVKHDPSRRKNPIPGGRGHYTFTKPVAMNSHTRARREALLAAFSGGN